MTISPVPEPLHHRLRRRFASPFSARTGEDWLDPPCLHSKWGGGSRRRRLPEGPMTRGTSAKTVQRAKRLRKEMSLPEVMLWQILRTRPKGSSSAGSARSAPMSPSSIVPRRRRLSRWTVSRTAWAIGPRRTKRATSSLSRRGYEFFASRQAKCWPMLRRSLKLSSLCAAAPPPSAAPTVPLSILCENGEDSRRQAAAACAGAIRSSPSLPSASRMRRHSR